MTHISERYKKFQFQNGTIKSYKPVRVACYSNRFQFQNGTIKRGAISEIIDMANWFQFQNGTIKRKQERGGGGFCLSFNSKMVRLKAWRDAY